MQRLNSYLLPGSILLLGFFLICSFHVCAQNDNQITCVVLSDYERADLKTVIAILEESDGITFTEIKEPAVCFHYQSEAQRISAMEQLYHRTFSVSSKNGLPLSFPLLPENPTPQQQQDFNEQKAAWIEANPDQYETAQQPQEPVMISQEEFDSLPEDKQQYILDNPDQYIIE